MPGSLRESDLVAVAGRLSLLCAVVGLLIASAHPPPRLIYSYHAQHFAAFYVLAFTAALAFKTARIVDLGWAVTIFGLVFEGARAMSPKHAPAAYLDWIADAGGVLAAFAPMMAQKVRARF